MTAITQIPFYKFSATGNDFILLDNRDKKFTDEHKKFFQEICQRRTAIGADGVLLIENSNEYDFRMRYFNADGSEATCGNGARTAAFFAHSQKLAGDRMVFIVGHEIYEAEVNRDAVKLKMTKAKNLNTTINVLEENFLAEGGYVNTGVPHYVLFADNVDEIAVEKIGCKYRKHPQFQPLGTNVNFVEIQTVNRIKVRTYERGVENETLSCGTGSLASAFIAQVKNKTRFPTVVETRGGELRVDVDRRDERLVLEGRVQLVFEGKFFK